MEQKQSQLVGPVDAPAVPALPHAIVPEADPERMPGEWVGTNASILNVIERLKVTIDEETSGLELRAPVDLDGFGRRKNRGLLELTRAMRMTQDVETDPRVVACLTGLRASLVRNQAALQIQLDAVREVSSIIARSIQEVESDGTYSSTGPKPCK